MRARRSSIVHRPSSIVRWARIGILAGAMCFLASASFIAQVRPSTIDAGRSTIDDRAAHQAVLQKYCVTCHNEKVKSGGLALSTLDLARVSNDIEPWEHVIRKVRTGAMP